MNPQYASGDFRCTWNGQKLNTGWGEDTFLEAVPNGPLKEVTFGADGSMTISKLADQGGTITMTFMQTADALNTIDEVSAAEQLVGEFAQLPFAGFFTFEDPAGVMPSFVALNTTLIDKGQHTHQKVVGERTITWACEKLIFGTPADILPVISQYIKD